MAKRAYRKSNEKKEIKRLYFALGLVFLVMIVFIGYLSYPLIFGKKITLATVPVDPFDLFRGQYMQIRYEISSVPAAEGIIAGDTVYVGLAKDGQGISRFKLVSNSKPANMDFIKGKVAKIQGGNLIVNYGIEQFFIEKGAKVPTQNITVEAKVDNFGNARITRLLQNRTTVAVSYRKTCVTS